MRTYQRNLNSDSTLKEIIKRNMSRNNCRKSIDAAKEHDIPYKTLHRDT